MSSNPDVPQECQHFAIAVESLNQQIANLEEELQNAPGIQVTVLQHRIQELRKRRDREQKLLDACVINPQPEPKPSPDFIATWTMVATVRTSNSRFPGPVSVNLVSALNFPAGCESVRLVGFSFTLPNGASVQQPFAADGSFNAGIGEINLPVTLLLTVPQIPDGLDKDAIVTFDGPGLTTETERAGGPFSGAQGIRLDRNTGQFSLVGTGIASRSIFDGTIIEVRLDGVLNPVPCV